MRWIGVHGLGLWVAIALVVVPAALGGSAGPSAAPTTYNGKYEVAFEVKGACKGSTGGEQCGAGYEPVAIPSIGVPLRVGQRLFPIAFTVSSGSGTLSSFTGDLSGSIEADGKAYGVNIAAGLPDCNRGNGPTILITFASSAGGVTVAGRWTCTIWISNVNVVTVAGTVDGRRVSAGPTPQPQPTPSMGAAEATNVIVLTKTAATLDHNGVKTPITERTAVFDGDAISTEHDPVKLKLDNGTTIGLDRNSSLRFDKSTFRQFDFSPTQWTLQKGSGSFSIPRRAAWGQQNPPVVKGRAAVVGAPTCDCTPGRGPFAVPWSQLDRMRKEGTEFTLETIGNRDRIRAYSRNGVAAWRIGDSSRAVGLDRGEETTLAPGGRFTGPAKFTAPASPFWK